MSAVNPAVLASVSPCMSTGKAAAVDESLPERKPVVRQMGKWQRSHKDAEDCWGPGIWGLVLGIGATAVLLGDLVVFGERDGKAMRHSMWAEVTLVLSVVILLIANSFRGAQKSHPKPCQIVGDRSPGSSGHKVLRSKASASSVGDSEAQKRKDVVKLSQAIEAAACDGDMKKAEELLAKFERSGVRPPAICYIAVLKACAKHADVATAEWWLQHMVRRGVHTSIRTYNILLDICAKADDAEACERWLGRISEVGIQPNAVTYSIVIHVHAKRGDAGAAETWFKRMVGSGIQPDAVSYNSLIHACAAKGAAESAGAWLEEMESQGLETSVETYTAVIDSCAKRADADLAEKWFARMLEKGVEPNAVTFSAMIDSCAKAGDLTRAEAWNEKMVKRGIASSPHSYGALIQACTNQGGPGSAEAAEQWLECAEQAGVAKDAVLFSGAINACARNRDAERALRIFHRMRAAGVKPNIIVYSTLARCFAHRGEWREVENIAHVMGRDGINTNDFFLYAQLLSYGAARPQQPDRAEVVFRSAMGCGVKANDQVAAALARAVGKHRQADLMQELCAGRKVTNVPSRRGVRARAA